MTTPRTAPATALRTTIQALLLAVIAGLPFAATAQTLAHWTAPQSGVLGPQLAVDAGNHSWVVGSTPGGAIQLSKLGPDGTALVQRSLAGAGTAVRSTSVSVDTAGNVVVTGYRVDSAGLPQGALVAKFDSAGNLLWQDVGATTYGQAYQARVGADGAVHVIGQQVLPDGSGGTAPQITVSKYSPQGAPLWVRTWGTNAVSPTEGLSLTPSGQVLVAGLAGGTGQARVAAFDAAGNTLWSTSLASAAPPALAVAPNGDFAVVGAAGLDFLVARFNAAFGPVWVRSYPARGYAMRAAFDPTGQLVVNGVSNISTGFDIAYAWRTIRLDAAGALLWTHELGAAVFGGNTPAGLAVGADGSAYLTGQLRSALATGGALTTTTTLKLRADGSQAWLASTAATSTGVALKTTGDGGVVVLGDNPMFLLSNTPPLAQVYRYGQSGAPNHPPVALASASPSAGPAPLLVQFSAAGSVDPDGAIASVRWDFGDGSSSTLANPSHAYAAGTYVARLTVTDTLGASTTSSPLAIRANAVVLPPAKLRTVALASPAVRGGTSTTARITVSSAAGVGLVLTSSLPGVAMLPATVVVPAGATSVDVVITTFAVRRDTAVRLTARGNGVSASAVLTVRR